MSISRDAETKITSRQNLIRKLATDIINVYKSRQPQKNIVRGITGIKKDNQSKMLADLEKRSEWPFKIIENLQKQLELDGYIYRDGMLYFTEGSVIDEREEQDILERLVNELPLSNQPIILNHLKLSADHYLDEKWGDSISNARNVLEAILDNIAHYIYNEKQLTTKTPDRPMRVRDFLEEQGFIDSKIKEAISKIYGLISEKGSHPNLSERNEARLMRHLNLTFSQYILLTFETYIRK